MALSDAEILRRALKAQLAWPLDKLPSIDCASANAIGHKIRRIRCAALMPQRTLAAVLGLDEPTVDLIERGRYVLTRRLVWEIANALRVEVRTLLFASDPPPLRPLFISSVGYRPEWNYRAGRHVRRPI